MKTGGESKPTSLYCNETGMVMKELDFKDIANGKISSRFKQVAVLIGVILTGIVLSFFFSA